MQEREDAEKMNIPETEERTIEAEPVPAAELADVRAGEATEKTPPKSGNIFIGTLNVFAGPLRSIMDPVKKVCYLPLQQHWEEKYEKRYPTGGAHRMLILDMTLLTIIGGLIVFGIFAYFILPVFPQPQLVSMQVLSPKTIVSGSPVDFIVAYRNETGSQLAGAELKVRLPEGFVAAGEAAMEGAENAARPAAAGQTGLTAATERNYPLGTLAPHGQGQVKISGTVYGAVGVKKALQAELYFWKEGSTTPTRVLATNQWPISSALLGLSFRMDDEVIRGRQNAVTISYSNNGDETIDAAVIRLTMPDDFSVTGTEPRMTGRNEWQIIDLEAGSKGAVTVYGVLRAGAGKSAVPNFTVRGYLVRNGARYLVQEIRQNVEALATGFELSQEVGKISGKMSLSPSEKVEVTVRYRNNGAKSLYDLKINLLPTMRYVAEPATEPVWDAANTPALAKLDPGASGSVQTTLVLKSDIGQAALSGDREPVMDISAQAQYFLSSDPGRPVYADTAVLSLPISTALGVKASALYFTKDGEQLGVGPLPPKVGETTKYWVFVQLTNTTNEVRDVKFEAALPPDIVWTGRHSVTAGQALVHLPATGQILWDVGRVPAYIDSASTRIGASFEVAVTPGKDAAGSVPVLVRGVTVTGLDVLTGAKIVATAPDVTTVIPFGPKNAISGAVTAK
jgi:hypothetical protein